MEAAVPELREDCGEIALAEAGKLPRLGTLSDFAAISMSIRPGWTARPTSRRWPARALGREYIALTDHSRPIAMVHGLDVARLVRQAAEIDRVNDKLDGITILKRIEVDILKDGSLDLPDKALAKLDVVVASMHSFFDLSPGTCGAGGRSQGRHLDRCPFHQLPEAHALRCRSSQARLARADRHHQHAIDR